MASILIENGTILTVNEADEVLTPGYVLVRNDRIAAVAAGPAPEPIRAEAGEVIDASRMAVMPGMVNAHVHLFQSFVSGMGGHRPLLGWLKEVAWPLYQQMTPEDLRLASMISLVENIRGGATSVIDNHGVHTFPDGDGPVCQAALEMGVRYLLARGWADRNCPPTLQETPEEIIRDLERVHAAWHGRGDGRIRVQSGPLVVWGCSAELLRRTHEMALAWGVGTHIHTAESYAEVEMSLAETGRRPVEWLADLGLLGPHTQLVHSVWLSDEEMDLVAESGSVIVHCPISNMYLASGICPVTTLHRRGAVVALGTDGQACNDGVEMLGILKAASNLQKVGTLDALALPPEAVIRMACRGGALAFGQPEAIGSLEPGKKADIVLVNLDNSRTMVAPRIASALVNEADQHDVDTVLVDGRVLMRGGRVTAVDEEALRAEAREAYRSLLRRTGLTT